MGKKSSRTTVLQPKNISKEKSESKISPQGKILNYKLLMIIFGIAFIIIGVLVFDTKLFLLGDDADYILDGYNFIHKGAYPGGRSSLYSMVLGALIYFVGTNVVILKCFSFLCAIIGFLLLQKAYYNKVSKYVFYPVIIFSIINSSLQYYSSSNLSEAFFMMIQYGFILSVFLLIKKISSVNVNDKKPYNYWLLFGFMSLLLSISKNVAVILPLSLFIYFLFKRSWKNSGYALASFLVFKIPYEILLRLIFRQNTVVSQLGQILAIDMYHPEKGQENFSGFFARFYDNIQIYFSNFTLKEFGLASQNSAFSIFPGLILIAVIFLGIYKAYKNNQYVFYTGIYTVMFCGVTFFAIQPEVAQERLIIIVIPLLLLLLLYSIETWVDRWKLKVVKYGLLSLFYLIIIIFNVTQTLDVIQTKFPEFIENTGGDKYYGYTQDWMNYLAMGEWVDENIPKNDGVAARKPNSLSVYSNGRNFIGIYKFPADKDANGLIKILKDEGVKYMILASIRTNPDIVSPNNIITTLHNYVYKIYQSYPGSIKIIHTIGGDVEPCTLVRIDYPDTTLNNKNALMQHR